MIEKSVVSLPPCWLALEVKAPPDLAVQRAGRPEPAGLLEKLPIAEGMRPKRVGAPTMIAS